MTDPDAIDLSHRLDAGAPADEDEAALLRIAERIAALDEIEPAPGWEERVMERWRLSGKRTAL